MWSTPNEGTGKDAGIHRATSLKVAGVLDNQMGLYPGGKCLNTVFQSVQG